MDGEADILCAGSPKCEHKSICELGYVCFRNSELICGQLGKATLGVSSTYQTCVISVRRYYKLKISSAAFWLGSIFWVQIMSLV
jgi:hypothetical protein